MDHGFLIRCLQNGSPDSLTSLPVQLFTVANIGLHDLPSAADTIGLSLRPVCGFGRATPLEDQREEQTGNRVSPTRTAQRRVDDLTNSGAPGTRVEASRNSELLPSPKKPVQSTASDRKRRLG